MRAVNNEILVLPLPAEKESQGLKSSLIIFFFRAASSMDKFGFFDKLMK